MKSLLTLILIFALTCSKGQVSYISNFDYSFTLTTDFTADNQGNVYVAAYYKMQSNYNGKGVVITKYGIKGKIEWTKIYKPLNNLEIGDIDIHWVMGKLYLMASNPTQFNSEEHCSITTLDGNGTILKSVKFKPNGYFMTKTSSLSNDSLGNLYLMANAIPPNPPRDNARFIFSLDTLLNIRFIKKIDNLTFNDFFLITSGNRLILEYGATLGFFDLNGQFLFGVKNNNGSSFPIIKKMFRSNKPGEFIFLATYSTLNGYCYALTKMNYQGQIIGQSSHFKGYVDCTSEDPEGNIRIISTTVGNHNSVQNPNGRHYLKINKDFSILKKKVIKCDSLFELREVYDYCDDNLKIFRRINRVPYTIREFNINLNEPGTGITVTDELPDTVSALAISQKPHFYENIDFSWAQQAFDLALLKDTTLIADTTYRHPACTPVDFLLNDTLMCSQGPLNLTAPTFPNLINCGQTNLNYSWNTGNSNNSIMIQNTGLYKASIEYWGCHYEDSTFVQYDSNYSLPDTLIQYCFDEEAPLEIVINPEFTGEWDGVSGNSFTTSKPGTHQYIGRTPLGCPVNHHIRLNNRCPHMVYVPNAFTPDGDGVNDLYAPQGEAIPHWEMTIFNRFGQEIFSGNESTGGWNGNDANKQQVNGLFIVKVNYTDPKNTEKKEVIGKLFIQR